MTPAQGQVVKQISQVARSQTRALPLSPPPPAIEGTILKSRSALGKMIEWKISLESVEIWVLSPLILQIGDVLISTEIRQLSRPRKIIAGS